MLQYGFRPGKSTLTGNLFQLFIFDSFKDNCHVDVLFTDFEKTRSCWLYKIIALRRLGLVIFFYHGLNYI